MVELLNKSMDWFRNETLARNKEGLNLVYLAIVLTHKERETEVLWLVIQLSQSYDVPRKYLLLNFTLRCSSAC